MVSWPIFRSSSPIRLASSTVGKEAHRRPIFGKAKSPLARHSRRPALQKVGGHLIFASNFGIRRSGVGGAHGGDSQITTVNSSGQIHFLTAFNVFVP